MLSKIVRWRLRGADDAATSKGEAGRLCGGIGSFENEDGRITELFFAWARVAVRKKNSVFFKFFFKKRTHCICIGKKSIVAYETRAPQVSESIGLPTRRVRAPKSTGPKGTLLAPKSRKKNERTRFSLLQQMLRERQLIVLFYSRTAH